MPRRGRAARLLLWLAILLIAVPGGLGAAQATARHGAPDLVYAALLALHVVAGAALLLARRGAFSRAPVSLFLLLRAPEVLVSIAGILFLFSFIYATNANMDYVQRFMTSHGNLRLAPDSAAERLSACLRYLPLILVDAWWYAGVRLYRPRLSGRLLRAGPGPRFPRGVAWALLLAMASGALYAFAFPSFIRAAGLPALGYVCLLPLLFILDKVPLRWGIFYGSLFGVIQTMISNYWLGTFDLLTLQFVSVVTLVQYIPFMAASLFIMRRSGTAGFLVFPAAWTLFDWLRSLGFLGYPWGMLGASQYAVIPLIQVASLTGVWGVTFLVTLFNSVAAWYAQAAAGKLRRGPGAVAVLAAALAVALGWGVLRAHQQGARDRTAAPAPSVRLALVQQDQDPRKDDYRLVFDTLRRLTEQALAGNPDMVVWSETAFVPNIRRWSREDPAVYPYAALVRDFLAWQKGIARWLVTGNDDYTLIETEAGEERLDYNGAVLFSPSGERVGTYHKIHLVPFTEYFPYRKQLPGIYALLKDFDAYLWEPGDRRVVFAHPKVAFSTPICFEDVFPDDVRRFVAAGARVIINLSNDYWSLTDTEAMQHAANAVFRAVENGTPLARASASGLTCLVGPTGRILARAPLYEASWLQVDVPVSPPAPTPYTRWGDWFPIAMAAMLLSMLAGGLAWKRVR